MTASILTALAPEASRPQATVAQASQQEGSETQASFRQLLAAENREPGPNTTQNKPVAKTNDEAARSQKNIAPQNRAQSDSETPDDADDYLLSTLLASLNAPTLSQVNTQQSTPHAQNTNTQQAIASRLKGLEKAQATKPVAELSKQLTQQKAESNSPHNFGQIHHLQKPVFNRLNQQIQAHTKTQEGKNTDTKPAQALLANKDTKTAASKLLHQSQNIETKLDGKTALKHSQQPQLFDTPDPANDARVQGLRVASSASESMAHTEAPQAATTFGELLSETVLAPHQANPTTMLSASANASLSNPSGIQPQTNWASEFGQSLASFIRQADDGTHTVTLRVDPPELGPLRVSLSLNDSVAHAVFSSAQAVVRHTLENAMPQLAQQLAQSGISLGDSQVNDQAPNHAGADQHATPKQQQAGPLASKPDPSQASHSNTASTPAAARPNAIIDTYA